MSETVVRKGPRRADAQHNYDVILATARAAVAERGGDIVLEEIARDAGVGIGTLYRHFPTRQDLLEAAFSMRPWSFVSAPRICNWLRRLSTH
jgi:AcrR family transcriptional regulator